MLQSLVSLKDISRRSLIEESKEEYSRKSSARGFNQAFGTNNHKINGISDLMIVM